MLQGIIDDVKQHKLLNEYQLGWLSELRPQNRWKPSDTEINILQGVIDGNFKPENVKVTLTNILEQLKKLREK